MAVLFAHLLGIEARTVSAPVLPDAAHLGMFGVDLFFVISGFIMVFITETRKRGPGASRPRTAAHFLWRRALRIYPLYWVVTAALAVVWLFRPELVFSSSPNQPQLFNTIFLTPSPWYPLLEVGWTLVFEMGFYIVFAAILLLPARLRAFGLIGWAFVVAAGLALGVDSANAVLATLFNPLTFEFLAGAAVAYLFLKLEGSRSLGLLLAALGLAGFAVWFTPILTAPDGLFAYAETWPRVLRATLPASALVLGAAWLDRHGPTAPRAAVRLGDWSYSLYLTHLLSLVLLAKLWGMAGLEGVPNAVFVPLAVAFAVFVAWLTYGAVERPLLRATRRLHGTADKRKG